MTGWPWFAVEWLWFVLKPQLLLRQPYQLTVCWHRLTITLGNVVVV
jgi:hypothetical protein